MSAILVADMKCHIELITTFNKMLHPRSVTIYLSPFWFFLVWVSLNTYCSALLLTSCRTHFVAGDCCAALLLHDLGHTDVACHCNWSCGVASTSYVFQLCDFFRAILCTHSFCAIHLKFVLLLLHCTIYLVTRNVFVCCGELDAHTLTSQLICISQPTEYLFKINV